MMKVCYFIFFLFFAIAVHAQVIPAGNRVEWNSAGYQPPTVSPRITVNVMDFGAKADGVSDNFLSFNNAVASLNGHYGIVLVPAGTYLLQSGITFPDSVIFRGAGSNSTFIKINSTGTCFGMYGTGTNTFTPVVSGFHKDSKKITVGNAALFEPGNSIELRQTNGTWDVMPAAWAVKVVGQFTKITAIQGDTLFIEDKLRIDYDPMLNPEVQKIIPRKQVCIEYLNIARIDTSTIAIGNAFEFSYAENCRVKGVESNKSMGSHCKVSLSSHIEITGSYFHDANTYDGVGTKGYGIALDSHSGLCLITNTIFKHLRHAMMVKDGANGNVFACNYSQSVYRNGTGEFPTDLAGDISLHGHYSYANLFEENIVQNIIVDETWGPSGPYNTFFRNRTEHYGIYMDATRTNNSNFVGNEIIGSFLSGFYTITGTGNFLFGNNLNGTITPGGTTPLNDVSCYLTVQPSFWNITDSWPALGISNPLNGKTIPAKVGYLAGKYTDMPPVDTTTYLNDLFKDSITLYPNPARGDVSVKYFSNGKDEVKINIMDSEGKQVMKLDYLNNPIGNITRKINISVLSKGIYLVNVSTEREKKELKLIVK